jgi:lipoate-protein ligase B
VRTGELIDWGRLGYLEAHQRQLERVEARKLDQVSDALIMVEHDHVFTLGRRRSARENVLDAGGVEVVEVERGGDVTYHGPGQIVAYPIIALVGDERDLHEFLRRLEAGMIATCVRYGLNAGREPGKTGVWIGGRKIGSIGIACRRWVTFHGVAFNATTDLAYFHRINPCGFDAAVMTSLAAETGRSDLSVERVRAELASDLGQALDRRWL